MQTYQDASEKACGTLEVTYAKEQADQIYAVLCNSLGDTVKLSKTGVINLLEIVVTGFGKSEFVVIGYSSNQYNRLEIFACRGIKITAFPRKIKAFPVPLP